MQATGSHHTAHRQGAPFTGMVMSWDRSVRGPEGGQARSQGKTPCPTLVFTLTLPGPAFPSAKSGVRELVFHLIFGLEPFVQSKSNQ